MIQSTVKALLAAGIASGLILTGCSEAPADKNQAAQQQQKQTAELDQLIASHTAKFMQQRPVYASFIVTPEEIVGAPYSHRMPDHSPAGFKAARAIARDGAAALEQAYSSLNKADDKLNARITADILRYYAGVEGVDYGYIDSYFGHVPYVVNQISGPLLDIPKTMAFQMTVNSEADAEAFLKRLAAFPDLLRGISAKMKHDADIGAIAPRILVERSLNYLDGFTAVPAADHFLLKAFAEKLDLVTDLTDEKRDSIRERALQLAESHMYQAYRALAEDVRNLLPRAGDKAGLWAQPNGESYYRGLVKFMGDTDLSPEEIHQIGLDEVARITAAMDAILIKNGHTEGTVGERMQALATNEDFLYPDSDEGRAALLGDLNGMIEAISAKMDPWFSTIPPQKVEVRRIPVATQDGEAGGFYTNPSLDGASPGVYWINLRDMKAVPRFSLNTLTYHEAVPGHHFQVALNLDQQGLPFLRRVGSFNAFTEGWALYSENLASEMGMYEGDPYGDLGRLQDEIFRAVRLVVDTGMHHKKWSREQAITYMAGVTGKELSEVTPEIERYMAWPGQALGYKLGMLKIQSLRKQAETALGERFDIRAFHDTILLPGAMPMQLVDDHVQKWIRALSDHMESV